MADRDDAFTGAIPEIYDRHLGPMLFEPYAGEMAGRFEGFEGAILETAAGTGRLTRLLERALGGLGAIIATDLNEPMLAHAAMLVKSRRVTWRQADAQALPFADASFDAVVCQFGVMFFPDKAAAYAEAHRVLKPGGRFLFSVWDRLEANELSRLLDDAVAADRAHGAASFLRRAPFGYHDEGVIRAALDGAGFVEVAVERVALDTPAVSARDAAIGLCMGTPLRNEIEARGPDRLRSAVDQAERALVEHFGSGPFTAHAQALVVTAMI